MKRFWMITVLPLAIAAVVLLGLMVVALYGYNQLTEEQPIAEITFQPVDEKRSIAELRTGDFCTATRYVLYGDQWRIDAEFIKWKYWASFLGVDSQYRLDRISGRYRDIKDENSLPHRAESLSSETGFEVPLWIKRIGGLNFLFDTSYGSSTYDLFKATRPPTTEPLRLRDPTPSSTHYTNGR